MRFLPSNFPSAGLSAIEERKLEYYYEHYVVRNFDRYGSGHFALACYAALPAVLTPDLLHKLWLNFKNYYPDGQLAIIHPVAPVDLLLSPLVEEIGFEIYEMPEAIRKALLIYLKETTASPGNNSQKLFGIDDIAAFLKDYAQYDFTPGNADDNAFREAQEWTALSYIDPGKAFAQVAQAFQGAATNPLRLRYKDAIEKMSGRFALEIVKDASLIPTGFKAMTALTSVVRDVLMKREPKKLDELKNELQLDNEMLTDTPLLRDNVINIEIPEGVEKMIQLPLYKKDPHERKLRAFVVGIEEKDSDNANFFARSVKALIPADQLEITLFLHLQTKTSRFNILEELAKIIDVITEKDDLLVYISGSATQRSGHCVTAGTDPLRDEDMGTLLNRVVCTSITVVLEVDHAATPYWLDTLKPNRVVFASCKYEQEQEPLNDLTLEMNNETYNAFTYAFVEAFKKPLLHISNRNLFIDTLRHYEKLMADTSTSGIMLWRTKAPQLLASPPTYNRFFLQGNNSRVQLQDLLRQTGFYHKASTGLWDHDTAAAFTTYRRSNSIAPNAPVNTHINALTSLSESQSKNQPPIFMCVLSDPNKTLKNLTNERELIERILNAKYPSYNIQLIILEDPTKEVLAKSMTDQENRNRIRFFYYGGFDTEGNFTLKDGVFNFIDFASLLDYQENIQLLVSNTCKSKYFADYVSQTGIQMAIGSDELVYDDYAIAFAVELFETIRDGKDIEAITRLSNQSNGQGYGSKQSK